MHVIYHVSKRASLFCSVFLAKVVGAPTSVVATAVPPEPTQHTDKNLENDDAFAAPSATSGGPGAALAREEADISEAVGVLLKRKAGDILIAIDSVCKRRREETDNNTERATILASAETDLVVVKQERADILGQLQVLRRDNELMKMWMANQKQQMDSMSKEIARHFRLIMRSHSDV